VQVTLAHRIHQLTNPDLAPLASWNQTDAECKGYQMELMMCNIVAMQHIRHADLKAASEAGVNDPVGDSLRLNCVVSKFICSSALFVILGIILARLWFSLRTGCC